MVLVQIRNTEEAERAEGLLGEVESLLREAMAILSDERREGRSTVALSAIREAGRLLELRGRLGGELTDAPDRERGESSHQRTVVAVRTAIIQALQGHPEALQDVAQAWRELGAG